MHRRFAALVAAVVVLTAACGDDDASSVAPEPSDRAATADIGGDAAPAGEPVDADAIIGAVWTTTEAGSARTTFRAEVPAAGEHIVFGGEGIARFGDDRGSLTLDIAPLLRANGFEGIEGNFDTVFERGRSLVRADLFDQLFSPPTPWLEFHVADLPVEQGTTLSEGLGGLTQFAGYDPAIGLRLLAGAIDGTARRLGADEVRGEATTHYTTDVDLRSGLATTAAPLRERLVARIGSERLRVDAHIDEAGLIRRVEYQETGVNAQPYPVTIEYHDFGVDEPVVLPPVEEVSDLFETVPLS